MSEGSPPTPGRLPGPPPRATPPPGWRPSEPAPGSGRGRPPEPPPPAPAGGRLRALAALAGGAALLVAGLAGAAMVLAGHSPAPPRLGVQSRSPRPAATAAPSGRPALPVITGLKVSDVTGPLRARGFTCAPPRQSAGSTFWVCTRAVPGARYSAVAQGPDDQHVVGYSGFVDFEGTPDHAAAAEFFGSLAQLGLASGDAAAARTWVKGHLDAPRSETQIGGRHLQVEVAPRQLALNAYPAATD